MLHAASVLLASCYERRLGLVLFLYQSAQQKYNGPRADDKGQMTKDNVLWTSFKLFKDR